LSCSKFKSAIALRKDWVMGLVKLSQEYAVEIQN
jgi:hypothetical protein